MNISPLSGLTSTAHGTALMKQLGDVCRIVNGTTPTADDAPSWAGTIVWITPTDLGKLEGIYIHSSGRTVGTAALHSYNLTLCAPGAVVLSSRAPIGHLGIAAVPLCTNQGCKTLIPGDNLISEYLYYALLRAAPDLQALGSGATFTEISKSQLERFRIPLPPLAEQERIAARLTEQLAAVESARAAAQERLAAAEALPAAYLREVFEGPEAREWETLQIDETCELLPSRSISTTGDAVVRAITTACLSESGFLPRGIKTARMRASDVPECVVRTGEILVARSNTPELVGRASIFNGEPAGVVATDLTIRVWPYRYVEPSFLAAFLSYLFQTGYWKEKAGGASGTMKKITREQLLALEFRVPPGKELDSIEDQRCIAAALALRLAEVERLTAILRDELAAIDALPAALLREAFNGYTDPQGG